MREKLLVFTLLISCLSLSYSNSMISSWHFDDFSSIINNQRIQIKDISFSSLKEVALPAAKSVPKDRPVSYLTFAFNWYFSGYSVFWYHLVNIFIHIASSCILFLTILRLYETRSLLAVERKTAFYTAATASLLWALNPIQVQAVTYIVQRMASLGALFYLAGLWCYLTARLRRGQDKYVYFTASFFCFLLAIGTKQNAVVFPAAIGLVELIFLKKNRFIERVNTATLFILIFASAVAVFLLLDFKYDLTGNAFAHRSFDLKGRILSEPRILIFYLSQIYFPLPWRFSPIHDVEVSRSLVDPMSTLFAIVVIGGGIAFAVFKRRSQPILSFSILFYFLNHIVESTVLNLELIFEHRNYLPSAFLFWPVSALLVGSVSEYWSKAKILSCGMVVLVAGSIIAFALWTYQRNGLWLTPETLWGDALKKYPELARPYLVLAASAMEKGQNELALRLYQESMVRKDPSPGIAKYVALHNMGKIAFSRGEFRKAIDLYEKALEMQPGDRLATYNLAYAYLKNYNYNSVLTAIQEGVVSGGIPWDEDMLALKGFVLLRSGCPHEAEHYFRAAYFSGGLNTKHLVGRACSLVKAGRYPEAEGLLSRWRQEKGVIPDEIIVLLIAIECEYLANNYEGARETVATLLAQYPVDRIMDSLSVENDSLPLDIDLIKSIIKKEASVIADRFRCPAF